MAAFLDSMRESLSAGDALRVGTDLIKPEAELLLAYDDPLGVTAAFNLNLLARMNRELGADFEIRQFAHEARWRRRHQRIEMHLRSRRDQVVEIPGARLRVEFERGETIWTESSHKFRPDDLDHMAAEAGFSSEARWIDREWPFAENLWIAR